MKFLATIKFGRESNSLLCHSEKEATDWLDSQNNNAEHTTIVDIFDDNWQLISSYEHTKGEE